MTVSVVIPSHNSAEFLADTIQSVRAQSFTDWELIVIDSGSSDGHLLHLGRSLAPRDLRAERQQVVLRGQHRRAVDGRQPRDRLAGVDGG